MERFTSDHSHDKFKAVARFFAEALHFSAEEMSQLVAEKRTDSAHLKHVPTNSIVSDLTLERARTEDDIYP